MKHYGILASFFCSAGLTLSAHDADTLAFYAFKEGDSGSSLAGNAIVNSAGGRFAGEVSVDGGTVQYSADAPGAYVFDSEKYGTAAICERPQSVRFSGNSTAGSQYVSFPGLGTAVSLNDDFTVEFFFKYAEGDGGANKAIPVLSMNCGLIYNPLDASIDGAGKPGLFGIMIHGNHDRYFDAYIVDRNHHRARSDANPAGADSAYPTVGFADGLWHHAAVVYVKSTKKYTVYIDYGVKLTAHVGRETAKIVLENPEEMLLGNGGFRGLISCLRVSKCARGVDSFLRASSLPTYSPTTVFHWSFDGENGTLAGELPSPLSADSRSGQFIANYAPCSGYGEALAYVVGSSLQVAPAYTNATPERGRYAVMSGGERICTSTNCLAVSAYGTDGNALCGDGRNMFPVSGSWTMEGWFNMDYPRYKENVVDVDGTNPHAVLFGLGYSYGTQVNGMDFSLYLHHTSGEFKLKLNAFDSNQKSYDPDGILLGSTFRDDAWHHVAVVYDASTFTMTAYIDGAALSSITMNAPFAPRLSQDGRRYLVGHGSGRREFFGMIDEVRLVQRALSPAEFISFEKVKYGLRLTIK